MIYHIKNFWQKYLKSTGFKCTYGHSGNDYWVSTLSTSYITVFETIMQSLISIGQL